MRLSFLLDRQLKGFTTAPPFHYARVAESADARDFMKVFIDNVYTNRENRKFVVYKDDDGNYHSMSYARYLVEQNLGRELLPSEDVHHKDGNKTNDILDNLEVVNSIEHRKHHAAKYTDTYEICAECGKMFLVTAKQHARKTSNSNRGHGKANEYFCSRHCSGKHNQKIQKEHQDEKSLE